jgi:integrase
MSKRRGHGEGSIHQRSDGRWVGVAELGWSEGKRRRKYVYGNTQREAIDQLRQVQTATEAGLPAPDDSLTVEQHLTRWISLQPDHLSANTIDNYSWAINSHLIPALGKKRLSKLTPTEVSVMLKSKVDAGLSASSRSRIRSVLVKALRQAEAEGLLQRNVAALAMSSPASVKAGRSLTQPQAKTLLKELEGHRHQALFTILLTMGLHPGEVTGLPWDLVDLDAGVLHVRQSLKRERGTLTVGDVKTPKSRRSLAIPSLALTSLRRHRADQARERLAVGSEWVDSGLVFASEVGTPLDPANVRRTLAKTTEAAGLGHWTPNELRHSAVSLLSAAGVPIEEIADVVGHDGTRMTTGIYRHVLSPVISSGSQAMDRMLGAG